MSPETTTPTHSRRRNVLEYAVVTMIAVALAVLIQAFVVKPYMIPSESMATTIVTGQRVLVDRLEYHYRDIHRGDIVVFRHVTPEADVLIKRVVGLPGDTLSIRDGRLYVNGKPLDEPYLDTARGVTVETFPGDITTPSGTPGWTLNEPYTLPPDQYFMMGDNRTDSFDSRFWGTVDRRDIIGRAVFTYWPLDRLGTP
jgi:signal peptidase I